MKNIRTGIVTLLILVASASAQTVNEDLKITAFDAMPYANFGDSVASDQGVLAVGAFGDDHGGAVSGSVYLYDSNPDSATYGSLLSKITATGADEGYFFGHTVAIREGVLAVGAIMLNDHEGVVYLFDSDPNSSTFGTQLSMLTATDKPIEDVLYFNAFGESIAIDQGVVFIGAPNDDEIEINAGAVYVFDGDPASPAFGTQLNKITASDGVYKDRLGSSISIHNGVLAVMSSGDDDGGNGNGSAYIFDGDLASATFGSELYKLTASDTEDGDTFESALSIDQGVLAISAKNDADPGFVKGSVYLFDVDPQSSTFGTRLRRIYPNSNREGSGFGFSVFMEQGLLAVGAPSYFLSQSQIGAVFFFDANPESPGFGSQKLTLNASDPGEYDLLGVSITIDHGVVAAGSRSDDNGMVDAGSVYIIDIGCPQDVNRDFVLDFYDLDAFMTLYAQNDLAVDFDGSGELDFFDVSEFLEDFAAGCPIAH